MSAGWSGGVCTARVAGRDGPADAPGPLVHHAGDMEQVVDSPFIRRVLIVLGLASGAVLLAVCAWQGTTALLATFAALLLAVLLRSLASLVQRWSPLGDYAALAVVCVALVTLLGAGVALLATPLQEQAGELVDTVPRAVDRLREQVMRWPLAARLWGSAAGPAQGGTSLAAPAAEGAMRVVSRVVSLTGYLVLLSFVGLFLAAEPGLYRRGLVGLLPIAMRPRIDGVLLEIGQRLQTWLLGRAALMLVITIATWIGLLALGIPLALALAVLAGLLTFIPNFGPVIAAVPAMLLALLESPMHVLYVGGLYLALQTAESYTLEPYVMRKADNLAPALVIVGQLFLGVTLGALGLILATPLIVTINVLVQRLYVEDVLGDHANAPEAPVGG